MKNNYNSFPTRFVPRKGMLVNMDEEIFKNLSNMLDNSGSVNNSQNNNSNFASNNFNNENNGFDFSNIDMATIMKLKNAMDSINSKKNDSRTNLLMSLKPYLKPSKKEKLDQYMKLLNISSVLEVFNTMGGEKNKWFLIFLF